MREVTEEEYQRLLNVKIREIEHEFDRYLTTVTLFYSIWKFFREHGKFRIEIEPTLKLSDTHRITPDIVFYTPQNIVLLIIEYKMELREKKNI